MGYGYDEYNSALNPDEYASSSEYGGSNEFPPMPDEFGEGGSRIVRDEEESRRKKRVKRCAMLTGSVLAAVLVINSSFGISFLRSDIFGDDNGGVVAASSDDESDSGKSSKNDKKDKNDKSGKNGKNDKDDKSDAGIKGIDEDDFPKLNNLDPDWNGNYAWNEYGLSEYFIIITDKKGNTVPIISGEIYGYAEDSYEGAEYDKNTNTLTLTNCTAKKIETNLMGNGFTIKLVGDNTVDFMEIWGAMYGGSLTLEGDGSLTITGKNNPDDYGIQLDAERSQTCLMIKKGVTLDIKADYAVVIGSTTMDDAVYWSDSLEMFGGKEGDGEFILYNVTVTDPNTGDVVDVETVDVHGLSEHYGEDYYDISIVGDDDKPSKHVWFEPAS